MEKLHVNLKENSYDILIDKDYSALGSALREVGAPERLLIVTDSNVAPLWLDTLKSCLSDEGFDAAVCILEAGEENKNTDGVLKICSACLENNLDRKSMILAFGGGVVGDMAGFAAAIYMRGIRFVQIPTTLLSQSDSSVGGKTGVDFMGVKNILGAFHQPSLVYINVSVLKTLPKREFRSGMGEVIKHGIIKDESFFEFLSDNSEGIKNLDPGLLMKMTKANCSIKAAVVEEDEKELGLRAILNFGHTIGHALESASDFKKTHGECVALGMAAATHIAVKRGLTDKAAEEKIEKLLFKYGFDIKTELNDAEEIKKYMINDKKTVGGKLKFILPLSVGRVTQVTDVSDEEIFDALKFLKK